MKIKSVLLLFLLAFSLFFSCSKKIVPIGFIGPLSGNYSYLGTDSRNALHLALQNMNEKNNKYHFDLVPFDDGTDSQKLEGIFKEMQAKGIRFCIGPMTSNLAEETLRLLKKYELLIISPLISSDKAGGKDDRFFRVMNMGYAQGELMLSLAREKKVQEIQVLYDQRNEAFAKSIFKGFRGEYSDSIHINTIPFSRDELSYRQIAEKIAPDTELVFIIANGTDTGMLSQHLRLTGYDGILFSSIWGNTSDLMLQGGKYIEGLYLISTFEKIPPPETFTKYLQDYKALFNRDPSFSPHYTYESFKILSEAILNTDSTDVETVRQYILEKSVFEGMMGDPIVFDPFGDVKRPFIIKTVKEGN